VKRAGIASLAVALCVSLGARTAGAADCSTLPTPIYVTGSTAAQPLLAEIGRLMSGQSPPVTIVYLGQGSCAGVDAILSGTPFSGTGTAAPIYWDATGLQINCDIAATSAVAAHIGISDVFASTCYQLSGGLPESVSDNIGPVQAMTFATHKSSTERAISGEAAYNVFGFGADSLVPPWTFEASIFKRDAVSGTQRMIAAAIGVPSERWKGTATASSTDMVTRLGTANYPTQSIGILTAAVAQDNRASVKVLAYQNFGQTCAVFPDSSETATEKANVRNGLYPIWGPLHLLIRLNGSGYPASAKAGEVVGYITGSRPTPSGVDLIKIAAQSHVVPQCAMRVSRSQEMGPIAPFAPVGACGCYYDKLTNGSTTCATCTTSGQCPGSKPACNYGYCEAQ
jgi:ABC-type phosphate transport system substrate-binding protein